MKETILDRLRRWSTTDNGEYEPVWIYPAMILACIMFALLILYGCASTPLPECPPCPPGPTIEVPVSAPTEPIPVPNRTQPPTCTGTSTQILQCIADYIQALRYEIEELRDEITAHNLRTE